MERLQEALDLTLAHLAATLDPAPEEPDSTAGSGYDAGLCWLAYTATGAARFRAAGQAALAAAGRRLGRPGGAAAPDLGFRYLLAAVNPWRLAGDEVARALAFAAAGRLMQRFHPHPAACLDGNVGGPGLLNLPLLWWAAAESGDGRPALLALRHLHTVRARLDPGGPERAWGALGFGLAYACTTDPAHLDVARQAADAICRAGVPAGEGAVAAAGLLEVAAWLGPDGRPYRGEAARLLAAANPAADPAAHYFYLEALLRLERAQRPAWVAS